MNTVRGEDSPGITSAPKSGPRLLTASLDEGLARLEYLVSHQRRLGLIVGPAGSGKTFLARQFARAARRQACDVLHSHLLGMDGRELLWSLVAQLGVRRDPREARFALWRALADRLAENRYERRPLVLFLDGIDQAPSEAVEVILRLLHLAAGDQLPLTCVLMARDDRFERIDSRLRELIDLRIEMEPWGTAETVDYLQQRFLAAELPAATIEESAVEQLQHLTGGAPREVAQLAELAVVAQLDQADQLLDAPTIVAVFEELSGAGLGIPLRVS